jgi:hypothetical protein
MKYRGEWDDDAKIRQSKREWILDERVGMIAIYRGPKRNCLSGIGESPDTVMVVKGKWVEDTETEPAHWEVDEESRALCHRVHAAILAAYEEGVKAEREECAKVAEKVFIGGGGWTKGNKLIAAAIRARGEVGG